MIEPRRFFGGAIFLFAARQHLIPHRCRPAPFVKLLRGQSFGWLEFETFVRENLVERNDLFAAPALRCRRAIPFVREKML